MNKESGSTNESPDVPKSVHTLRSPSGQISQHLPFARSAGMGSGQGRGAQRTRRQSTKSVRKRTVKILTSKLCKLQSITLTITVSLTTLLKNMSSVHTIFSTANAAESSFV